MVDSAGFFYELSAEVQVLVEGFCESLEAEFHDSPHTIRAYRSDVEQYLRWCAKKDLNPLSISHRQLRLYLADLDAARYERSTINRHLSAVKGFYRWLVITERITTDPASVLKGPKQLRSLPRALSAHEMQALLSAFDPETGEEPTALALRNRALLEFLYACGARVSEAASLTCDKVDLKQGLVRVFGKGGKERMIPLHRLAVDVLRAYLQQGRPELVCAQSGNYVFLSSRGNPLSADAIRRVFKQALKRAGIDESLSPHAMRHTFATDVLSGGADLRSVQEMLGHASLSTTQIYTHLSPEHLKKTHQLAHPRG